ARNNKDREAARKAAAEAQKLERETRKLRKEFASMEKELALRKKEAQLAIAESAAKAEEIKALKEELDKLNAQRAALLSAEKKTFLFFAIVLGTLLAILLKNLLVGRLDRRLAPGEFSERNVRRLRFLTLMRIANWVLSVVFVMVGGFMVLKLFGFSLTTTLAGAGVLGMALGFGGQYVIRDMFAGLSIVLEGQYSMNDIIRIGEHQGVVEDVNLRFTRLRNLDGTVVYIPNGEVKTVMNFSKEFAQATVALYLDYATDIDDVLALIERIVDEVRSDDSFRRLIIGGVDLLGIHKFTPTGPKIRFRVKTLPGEQWRVARELRLRLKKGMDQQGLRFFRFAPEQRQAQLADASG
ncbi:MAG TPA: mechanosensitive ion channel, partial [Gammaproteobacteria bacterium]|nr:mechanosensitive ion channel [Gammaproteobacteria bacterium]